LIKAFNLFKKDPEHIDIKLYIVGDGHRIDDYKLRVNELGLNTEIIFTGAIDDDIQLKQLFQKSYAYVSPGDVGLGVLHSFAYGIPVITRNEKNAKHGPEFHNLVHEENCLIYDGKITGLVDCMKRVTTEKNLSFELGKNAFDFYKSNRKPKHMIKAMLSIIGKKNEAI